MRKLNRKRFKVGWNPCGLLAMAKKRVNKKGENFGKYKSNL